MFVDYRKRHKLAKIQGRYQKAVDYRLPRPTLRFAEIVKSGLKIENLLVKYVCFISLSY